MNDLISRDDALNFEMNLEAESEQEMLGIVRGMQIYANHIKSLPGVGWIKVTERLPIMGDRVICFGANGINIVDFVCGDKWSVLPWFYLDGEQETGVTHWMPLPEPPKEDKP